MKRFSPLLIIIAATLWGTMGLFTRTLTSLGFETFQLVLTRASLTAVSLIIYLSAFDRDKLKIKLKDLWIFLSAAIISVVLFQYCYTSAIKAGSMSIAATLLYTSPIFVTIISAIIFKEKITPIKIIALAMAFAGCVLVSGLADSGDTISPKALFLGISSGLTYGLYSIFTKIGIKKYSPLTFTAYTFLFATLILIPLSDIRSMSLITASKSTNIIMLILFGLVTSVIPYTCFTCGLKYIEASKANITATIEPVVATLIGTLVFKEQLSTVSAIGIAAVILSAIILNVPNRHQKQTS